MTQRVRWHGFADAQALQHAACARILSAAEDAIGTRGRFDLVLAGGSTPQAIYHQLRTAAADWQHWWIWFGDERCLPADDAQRNSHMAAQHWLDHVPIPSAQIRPIPAELGAQAGALEYAKWLQTVDEFDLVLLGLGEDGHTASLFPGRDPGTAPDVATIAVFDAPKPPPQRISLSASRLGRAHAVLFLVSGESKREAVQHWRSGVDIPAMAIAPVNGVDVLMEQSLLKAGGSPV